MTPVEVIHRDFLERGKDYPESDLDVHIRWTYILTHVPEVRGRFLWDDLTAIYVDAEKNATGSRLAAVSELAALQTRFWWVLNLNKACRPHVYDYWSAIGEIWQARLLDRRLVTKGAMRKDRGHTRNDQLRKPVCPKTTVPTWAQ